MMLFCYGHVADAQTDLPDVQQKCDISQDEEFRRLFNLNRGSLRHIIPPPNNLKAFTNLATPTNPVECLFFEKAHKMFPWVTSPYGRDSDL